MADGPDPFHDIFPESDLEDEIIVGPTRDGGLGIGDCDGPSIAIPLKQVPSFIKRVTEVYGVLMCLSYDQMPNEERPWTTGMN